MIVNKQFLMKIVKFGLPKNCQVEILDSNFCSKHYIALIFAILILLPDGILYWYWYCQYKSPQSFINQKNSRAPYLLHDIIDKTVCLLFCVLSTGLVEDNWLAQNKSLIGWDRTKSLPTSKMFYLLDTPVVFPNLEAELGKTNIYSHDSREFTIHDSSWLDTTKGTDFENLVHEISNLFIWNYSLVHQTHNLVSKFSFPFFISDKGHFEKMTSGFSWPYQRKANLILGAVLGEIFGNSGPYKA